MGEVFTIHGRVTMGIIAFIGLWTIARWIAHRQLALTYGIVWLGVFAGVGAVAAFPGLIFWLGRLAGSREPEGAVRLAGFVFIAFVLLYLSLRTSQLERRLDDFVQGLALREVSQGADDPEGAPNKDHPRRT